MQNLILIPFLIIFSACSPPSDTPPREADIKALTTAKVQTWRALYRNNDAEGLSNFLHDDFVFIPGNGEVLTKLDEVEYLSQNETNMPDDFLYHVEDIIFTGPDTAIVYGKGHSTRTNEANEPCQHTYWSSNTFRRVEGRWRPTFSHVSGAKCE